MDLIKQVQSACQFPEFREEEKLLVAELGRYLALLPEPSRRDWFSIVAIWILLLAAAPVLVALPAEKAIGADARAARAMLLLAAIGAFILLGALYILLAVRSSALQSPEIFAVQQQITEHGARIALMFRTYRKGIVAISHVLFRHLKSCARFRTRQLETAQDAIEALFSEICPDANKAKRNRKTKTKVPRESDYTLEDFVGGSDTALAAFEKAIEQYDRTSDAPATDNSARDRNAAGGLPTRLAAIETATDMECRTELRFLKVTVTTNQDLLIADVRALAEDLGASELAAETERLTQGYILDPVQNLLENLQAAQDILLDAVYARGDDAPEMWTVNISSVSRRLISTRKARRRRFRIARAIGGWLPLAFVAGATVYVFALQRL